MKEVMIVVGGFFASVIAGTMSALALLREDSAGLALLVGTIVSYVLGGLWYHFLVRKPEVRVSESKTPADRKETSVGGAV